MVEFNPFLHVYPRMTGTHSRRQKRREAVCIDMWRRKAEKEPTHVFSSGAGRSTHPPTAGHQPNLLFTPRFEKRKRDRDGEKKERMVFTE